MALAKLDDLVGSLGPTWRNDRTDPYRLPSDLNTRCGSVSVSDSLSLMHRHTVLFQSEKIAKEIVTPF